MSPLASMQGWKLQKLLGVIVSVAVHLGVKMADTLSFTAKVDISDFPSEKCLRFALISKMIKNSGKPRN